MKLKLEDNGTLVVDLTPREGALMAQKGNSVYASLTDPVQVKMVIVHQEEDLSNLR